MSTAMLLVTVAGVWAVLIWAGIAWVHYLADDRGPLDKSGLVGIRGWLTLLVGGLIGWGPIISVGRFFLEFSKAESLYPAIKRLPEWQTYTSVIWFLVLVVTAWQIHVGWRMCRERDPSVVAYLKKYLWLSPLTILLLGMPNVLVLKAEYPAAEMFPGAIGVAIVNGIWLWYLSKSKRVARTYNLGFADDTITASPQAADVTAGYTRKSLLGGERQGGEVAASGYSEGTTQAVAETSRAITSVEEKISQHRLERTLGSALDEELYAKCLADCDFDHLRATALYQRRKAGLIEGK